MNAQTTDAFRGEEHRQLREHVRKQHLRAGSDVCEGILIGDERQAQAYRAAFMKYAQCNELHRAARTLCAHEVAQFQARAISIGHFFPSQFPQWSLATRKPKFHALTYVLPAMAVRRRTVGLSTEQVIEVLHAHWNRRKHLYWSIKKKDDRLGAQMKDLERHTRANRNRASLVAILDAHILMHA